MKPRAPAPWLFAILNVPHAVVTGGVSGTLFSFLLRQQGVAPHAIANQRALLLLPGSLFFLWSPVTDFLLRRKTWLLLACRGVERDGDAGVGDQQLCEQERGDAAVDLVLPDPAGLCRDGWADRVADAARPEDTGGMLSAGRQPGGRSHSPVEDCCCWPPMSASRCWAWLRQH